MEKNKWDNYYDNDKKPPWESDSVFHGLIPILSMYRLTVSNGYSNVIELGSGRSQSAIYLGCNDYKVTAVDFCEKAIEDGKRMADGDKVNWILCDILDDDLFTKFCKTSYDIVFDMQCFHILRGINESRSCQVIYDLLRKEGYAIIVVGAKLDNAVIDESKPGPVFLTRDQLINPFISVGLKLISIEQSTFNSTEFYLTMDEIPKCWIGVFKK